MLLLECAKQENKSGSRARKSPSRRAKRATSPLESEQSSAAVLRLFPHHAAFGEGRAAPGKAPGKHLASTWQAPGSTRRARCRIETRAVRARCRPGQDAPGRKLRAPSADPPCSSPFHAAKARKSMQRHAKEILFLAVAISSFPRSDPESISTTAASQSMKTGSHSKLATPLSRAAEFHIGRVLVSNR